MYKIFSTECNTINSNNNKSWAFSVKTLLYDLGLKDILDTFNKDKDKSYFPTFFTKNKRSVYTALA